MNAYPIFQRPTLPTWAGALLACLGASIFVGLSICTVVLLRERVDTIPPPAATVTAEVTPRTPVVTPYPPVQEVTPPRAVEAVVVAASAARPAPARRTSAHRQKGRASAKRTLVASRRGKGHAKDDLDRILGL